MITCTNCEDGDVIVEDLEIIGMSADGTELEIEFVSYRCLGCDSVWTA